MLLEALIAILIFSVGILSIVGMQSVAVKNVVEGKTRSDAGFLADQIIAKMWTDTPNIDKYAYPGTGTEDAKLTDWMNRVKSTLPGVDPTGVPTGVTAALPEISVTDITTNAAGVKTGGKVKITMKWQLPQEMKQNPVPLPHQYVVVASININ
jgi:type IV pilus assembly protein PilV